MKKLLFLTLFSTAILNNVTSQVSSFLSGEKIRSNNSSKYTSNNLFDNNPQTPYEATIASGAWIGLDLGTPHVITSIEFAGGNLNMQTGIFEGANDPSFKDAVILYFIKNKTQKNVVYNVNTPTTKGFRYVRYIGANNSYCAINELKFFGYEGIGNDSKYYQITNIPTVVVNTETKADITSKTVYQTGNISIIDSDGKLINNEVMEIRGRGNASWDFPKKGFRVKLNKKKQLLDAPSTAKNWTLIASYRDKSVLRNALGFDISKQFGFEYTPYYKMVDLVVNGDYRGTYALCDQIEVKPNRVDIEEQTPEDIALPNIEGGYLIELDGYATSETSYFLSKKNNVPVTIKYPKDDEINKQQSAYISNHFNQFENALFSSNYTDPTTGYRAYLDTKSFLKYFLFEELIGNSDAFWSTYMTKHRGDNLFYTGPVWDLDLAFENDSRQYPNNNLGGFLSLTKGSSPAGLKTVLKRLFSDPSLNKEMAEIWADLRSQSNITKEFLTNRISYLKEELKESADLNFVRWPIMLDNSIWPNVDVFGSYEGEVNHVMNYSLDRLLWMDNMLNYKSNKSIDDNTYYSPVALSGFNSDVITEGLPMSSYMTRGLDANSYCFYTKAVRAEGAIPDDGLLQSSISNAVYQMESYNKLNTLYIASYKEETINLVDPINTKSLSLLVTSLAGHSRLYATVNYTDGTSETNLLKVDDFYTNPHVAAITSLQVKQTYYSGSIMGIRLFEHKLITDVNKTIKSITLKNSYTGRAFLLAVSSQTESINPSMRSAIPFRLEDQMIENNVEQKVSVYPNPISKGDYIQLNSEETILSLKLMKMNGSLLKESKVNANQTKVSTSDIVPGVYLLQIKLNNNTAVTKKVIIK